MGRRALRKIDPNIDLSWHLVTWEQLPRPWQSAALFGRRAPVEIEVGSGKGLFLLRAAGAQAAHDFLGIEVATRYARFTAARLARHSIRNARVVCGDARRVFSELLPDAVSVAVHVYFPDPWWKQRHAKRRVMNAAFLRDVDRVLAAGGVLHFWTDVEAYFTASLELIARHTSLDGPRPVPQQPAADDLDYHTHLERRMRLTQKPVYRVQFSKSPALGGQDPPDRIGPDRRAAGSG